jgi:hypothetical protein
VEAPSDNLKGGIFLSLCFIVPTTWYKIVKVVVNEINNKNINDNRYAPVGDACIIPND